MTEKRIELTEAWINQTVSEGTIFNIAWKELGLIPSNISMRDDGKTFDVTIPCLPLTDKTGAPEETLRTAIENAIDVKRLSHGYKLGSFSISPHPVTHPAITQKIT